MSKIKTFKTPMYKHNGFYYPLPNNIDVRWSGFYKGTDHFKADSINYMDALQAILCDLNLQHIGLTNETWDKISIHTAKEVDGFGFTIVNAEKYFNDLDKREKIA